MNWESKKLREVNLPEFDEHGQNAEVVLKGAASVDISGGEESLEFGKETLFVNASIMDLRNGPDERTVRGRSRPAFLTPPGPEDE